MAPSAAEFRPRVERLLNAFGRDPESEPGRRVAEAGARFAELVLGWSERVDLTATRDPDELVDLLFADAAAILRSGVRSAGESWLDVGSGMGAPGVAIALLDRTLRVTLVEDRKSVV